MAENGRYEQLRSQLDQIASRGAKYLRRFALKEAVESAMRYIHWIVIFVPSCFLVASLIEFSWHAHIWPLEFLMTVLVALLVPLVFLGCAAIIGYLRANVERSLTLALFDRELGYKDRLQTADEFLSSKNPSNFESAAIDDAIAFADQALAKRLGPIRISSPSLRTNKWQHGVAALGLLAVAALLSMAVSFTNDEDAAADPYVATLLELDEIDQLQKLQDDIEDPLSAEKDLPDSSDESTSSESDETATNQETLMRANLVSSLSKKSLESGLSGGASQENQSGGASSSLSGQGSPQKKPQKPDDNNRSKPNQARKEDPKENEEKESVSGIAGGKGSGSGQQSSPTEMRENDTKALQQDKDGDIDLEADDEEDEQQESASASRPLLNQRKAAADRQLSPSAGGDEENEDANGRSGPGGLKKTRGVAAMLLGVPMPDRLHSQINAGRVKVQRERSVPKPNSIASVAGQTRGEMDEGIGKTNHYELKPWMRNLVKKYFLTVRESPESTKE